MTTLEEVAAAILDGHEALSLLRVMSVDTMHLLEHEYEETGNEDVLRVLVLAHHLYRRITEDERLAEIRALFPWDDDLQLSLPLLAAVAAATSAVLLLLTWVLLVLVTAQLCKLCILLTLTALHVHKHCSLKR